MLTFGPRVTQTEFDYNIFQGHDPICAIRCQEMIMRDYGIQIPKDELTQFATDKGWYHGHGTKENDVGNLLEVCNIGTHTQHCDSVYDLINELKEGHRVIVAVDSHELWAEPGSKEYEFYRHLTHADHALIVTSVSIDPLHPENSTVVLTDPGNGSILEYDFERFAHSWKDSNWDSGKTWSTNITGDPLYFPAAGYRLHSSGSLNSVGSSAFYWSASPYNTNKGHNLNFNSNTWYWRNIDRANGFSVRPVAEE